MLSFLQTNLNVWSVWSVFVLYRRLGERSLLLDFQKSIFDLIQKNIDHQLLQKVENWIIWEQFNTPQIEQKGGHMIECLEPWDFLQRIWVFFKSQCLCSSSRPDHRWDASFELQRCDASWVFKLITAHSHCSCSTTPDWTVRNISVVERGTTYNFTVLSDFVLYRRLGKIKPFSIFPKECFRLDSKEDWSSIIAKSRKLNNRRTI